MDLAVLGQFGVPGLLVATAYVFWDRWSSLARVKKPTRLVSFLVTAGLAAVTASYGTMQTDRTVDDLAVNYVKLVLSMAHHDADYVDAYYGPEAWQSESDATERTLRQIDGAAAQLISELDQTPGVVDREELVSLRRQYLRRQLVALRARVQILEGRALTFDDESRALYDAVAPTHPESYFQDTLRRLDQALPGQGDLIDRYEAFREDFIVPRGRLDGAFDTAIAECRRRTLAHVRLPNDESFTVEYVSNKSWSGYNWYQGNFRSLIQVNTDLPIYIDRVIDLACHEGYPGHHVYNVLLEEHLVRGRGWPEFSVYALFSPQSLIAEGTANYGIEVAFPGDERVTFEREMLFPAVGLDAARVDEYYAIQTLVGQLDYAANEAARRYLNGEINRAAATDFLVRYALMAPARAEQRTRFFDQYRSYVINYNLGKDLVAAFVESRSGGGPDRRWDVFGRLLASPRLPSGLN